MHELSIPPHVVERVVQRAGRAHPVRRGSRRPDGPSWWSTCRTTSSSRVSRARCRWREQSCPRSTRACRASELGGHVVWIKRHHDARELERLSRLAGGAYRSSATAVTLAWSSATKATRCGASSTCGARMRRSSRRGSPPSSRARPDIEAYLRGRGIDTLLIGGTATHVCCESTARDAMMLNFKVVMVAETCSPPTTTRHNASLAVVCSNSGDVQTVEETIAALKRGVEQAAASPSAVAKRSMRMRPSPLAPEIGLARFRHDVEAEVGYVRLRLEGGRGKPRARSKRLPPPRPPPHAGEGARVRSKRQGQETQWSSKSRRST